MVKVAKVVLWLIGKERNDRIFKDSVNSILLFIVVSLHIVHSFQLE